MLKFSNKHIKSAFLYGIKKDITTYLKGKKVEVFFGKDKFFNYTEENKNIIIHCYESISEIDFIYRLLLNLNKERNLINFIENDNTKVTSKVLKKAFNNNHTSILKKIVLYEYKKKLNNNIVSLTRVVNIQMMPNTFEQEVSISQNKINYIKKILQGSKIQLIDFLVKELSENNLKRFNDSNFLEIYTTYLDKDKEKYLNDFDTLNTIKNELEDIKELDENNPILTQENIFFLDSLIEDIIKLLDNCEVEKYYRYYKEIKGSKNILKHLKAEDLRKKNIKKNEIIIGNSGTGKTHLVFSNYTNKIEMHNNIVCITETNYDYFKKVIIEAMLDYFFSFINSNNFGISTLPAKINRSTRIIIDESNRNNFQELLNKFNFLIESEPYSKVYELHNLNKEEVKKLKQRYDINFSFYKDKKDYQKHIIKEINTGLLLLDVKNPILKERIKSLIDIIFYQEEVTDMEIPVCAFPTLNFTLIMNTVDFNTKEIDLMLNRRCAIKYISYNVESNHKNFQILKSNFDDLAFKDKKNYDFMDWLQLQKAVNNIIKTYCHDSKCIGYYFWTDYFCENENNIIMFEDFKSKLIYYLYGSVLNNFNNDYFSYNIKDEKNIYFFKNNKSFNDLMESKNIMDIFSDNILKSLNLIEENTENEIIKVKE